MFCAIAAAVVLVVSRVEHLPLASMGLQRPRWPTVVSGLLLGLGTLWLLPLVTQPLVHSVQRARVDAEMRTLVLWPVWFRCSSAPRPASWKRRSIAAMLLSG